MTASITAIEDMRNKKISRQDDASYRHVKELVTGGTKTELRQQRIEASRNFILDEEKHNANTSSTNINHP